MTVRFKSHTPTNFRGLAERLIASVLKTEVGFTRPQVQILYPLIYDP